MGVPRTLAKGLSKLKEAAELRKLGGTQAERMARAAEQGYDTGTRMYRGTTNLGETRATESFEAGGGVFTSDNPDVAEIFRYPREYGEVQTSYYDDAIDDYVDIEPGDLQELFVRRGKTLIAPDPVRFTQDTAYQSQLIRQAKLDGYDSITVPDVDEGVGDWTARGTTVVALKPQNVRSINADFNPANRDSPNLLAGIAGAMPYAGATAALLAGATPQEAEAGPLQTLGRAAPYLTSAALGGAAALQSGDAEASFIGTLAKTFPHDMLGMARKMKDYGLSRAEIWRKTGIDLDNLDGLPRSELPDYASSVDMLDIPKGEVSINPRGAVGDVFNTPDLYAAYPDLASVRASQMSGRGGEYSAGGNTPLTAERVTYASPSSGFHEIQHAIQEREGFALGGNELSGAQAAWEQTASAEKRLRELENSDALYEGRKAIDKAFNDALDGKITSQEFDKIAAENPLVYEWHRLQKVREMSPKDGNEAYKRLAGEAEARNVQTRLNMTDAERRATPPWETLDVPESEQIVRMRGNATPALLGATAVGTGAGMYAASPEQAQAYNDYIRDEMEARTAAESFAQMRGSKAGYWEARRQELLDMVSGLGALAQESPLLASAGNPLIRYGIDKVRAVTDPYVNDAIDRPLRAVLAGAGALANVATGENLATVGQNAQQVWNRDSLETTGNLGDQAADWIMRQGESASPNPLQEGAAELARFGLKWIPQVASPI